MPLAAEFNIIRMMARFCATTALVWLVPFALAAQEPQLDKSEPETPNSVGVYQGVVPGTVNPPAVKVPPGGQIRQATWPGLQMLANGGSRIFVQLTSKTEVQFEMQPDKMVLTLKNTAIAGPTNAFPLETRYFNTPVKRARLKAKDRDTLLILDLRREITPIVSNEGARDGYFFVYLDFPAGNYLSEAPLTEPAGASDGAGAEQPGSLPADTSASSGKSTSGRASSGYGISKKQVEKLYEEKPPPVTLNKSKASGKAKASGKFKFGVK